MWRGRAQTVEERRTFLLRNRIAMWDVLASCAIRGASDASIRDAVPNDLSRILDVAPSSVYTRPARKAHRLYRRYLEPVYGRECTRLPSTSPANAAMGLDGLIRSVSDAERGRKRSICHFGQKRTR